MYLSLRTLAMVALAGVLFAFLSVIGPAERPDSQNSTAERPDQSPTAESPDTQEHAAELLEDAPAIHGGPTLRGSLRELEMPAIEIPVYEVPPVETLEPGSSMHRTYQAIRDAVEGKRRPGGTGHPIADDIMGVVRTSGTVLEDFPDEPQETVESRRAIAAEQLLRAARLLEKFGEGEPEQVALVRQMRSEAERLLSAE